MYGIIYLDGKSYSNFEIFAHIKLAQENNKKTFILDEDEIKINSRYRLFMKKGTQCCHCGLKGIFWVKRKGNGRWYINLYGVTSSRSYVKLTQDHIVPRSQGGTNRLVNLQPLCETCNSKKASMDAKQIIKQRLKHKLIIPKAIYITIMQK